MVVLPPEGGFWVNPADQRNHNNAFDRDKDVIGDSVDDTWRN